MASVHSRTVLGWVLLVFGLWLGQSLCAPGEAVPLRKEWRQGCGLALCDADNSRKGLKDSPDAPLTCLDSASNPLEDGEESPDAWPIELGLAPGCASTPGTACLMASSANAGGLAPAHLPGISLALCRLRC
ncbi:MAG TPA: hypothetical protein VGY53_05620 [Isosphaeraceae bacterium]|nr:hypothetical protein [Isosphaeraceae bacterium]